MAPEQRDAVQRIETFLIHNEFDQRKLNPHLPDLVGEMGAACVSKEDKGRMMEELDRVVHWQRLPGYWLTYLFQLAMQRVGSFYFPVACQLYAKAQINVNADLCLMSLENGYAGLMQWLSTSGDTNENIRKITDDFRKRMRQVYRYYRRWYTPEPYSEINPLTEHLYSEMSFTDLAMAFPRLDKPRTQLVPDDYLSVIDQCQQADDSYACIVARRFLGHLYQGQGKWEAAREQFWLGLEAGRNVSLDTEIGHFYRHYGYALYKTGHLREAAQQFERAAAYESHPVFGYWRALALRELGDVRLKMAPREVDIEHPPAEIEHASRAYKAGRLIFEAAIGRGIVPVARSVNQQLFRSYTDNALQVALSLRNTSDTLAEVEASGPRYATELVAESIAASSLPSDVQARFRQDRAIFHQHLTTFNQKSDLDIDFSQYLASVESNREARRLYQETRNALTDPVTHAQLSDEIANKVLALRLPGVLFLLFHLGENQTYGTLLDVGSGEIIAVAVCGYGERHWRAQHETYQKALQDVSELPDPALGMSQLLDDQLGYYENALGPLLEDFLPYLKGRHLKIFPRLFLNEVPFHALKVGNKRLIEYCQVSYAQTLGLFLQVHQPHKSEVSTRTLAIVCDDKGAPAYQGTLKQLSRLYNHDLRVLRNPQWEDFESLIDGQHPADIFFACHGQFDPDDPTASSLFLSQTEEASFSKIFSKLDLAGCECVTLGACESGLGHTIVTAEYLGLPIAFFAAGVRYVISSLWEVNQFAAAILLGHHYQFLHDGQHTVTSALNEAQRALMQMSREQVFAWIQANLPDKSQSWGTVITSRADPPFAHPYYWAGFFVAGDV
ncbi:hypothetical protein BIU88_09510 [Chlorobaculum limnaeum]|uniref:CHAT domain-containing protein n=1 Tax=Chlorobaculum limnaeum TaxID=274537 RepID=A0A1D8D6D1_CHLLM|nr:CHAT domain-containing protein [Chlorobaculum limnaeum]AOS84344.1 hypothetical protein BIU88_09510 [Chlorobaculum limnaeum]